MTMPKYIDVDALGIGEANPEVFLHPEYAHGWNSAVEIVLTAPAADVTPVVRCEACRFWTKNTSPDDGWGWCNNSAVGEKMRYGDFFCAFGCGG